MKTEMHIWSYLAQSFLEWEMFRRKVVEKIKTHILYSMLFFFEIRVVYEIMWKNSVEACRSQTTIWRMRAAYWIPKLTNTHSEYITLIAFPLQHWLHERSSVLRNTHIACLVPPCKMSPKSPCVNLQQCTSNYRVRLIICSVLGSGRDVIYAARTCAHLGPFLHFVQKH